MSSLSIEEAARARADRFNTLLARRDELAAQLREVDAELATLLGNDYAAAPAAPPAAAPAAAPAAHDDAGLRPASLSAQQPSRLSTRELKEVILDMAATGAAFSNEDVVDRLLKAGAITPEQHDRNFRSRVSDSTNRLAEKGYLIKTGSKRGTRYAAPGERKGDDAAVTVVVAEA